MNPDQTAPKSVSGVKIEDIQSQIISKSNRTRIKFYDTY